MAKKKTNPWNLAKCPQCKGTQFGPVRNWIGHDGKEWPHTKCLDCGVVQYAMNSKGWTTNGYCGSPREHYAEK